MKASRIPLDINLTTKDWNFQDEMIQPSQSLVLIQKPENHTQEKASFYFCAKSKF